MEKLIGDKMGTFSKYHKYFYILSKVFRSYLWGFSLITAKLEKLISELHIQLPNLNFSSFLDLFFFSTWSYHIEYGMIMAIWHIITYSMK